MNAIVSQLMLEGVNRTLPNSSVKRLPEHAHARVNILSVYVVVYGRPVA